MDKQGRRRLIEDVILKNDWVKQYWDEHIVNEAADSSIDTVSTAVGDITFTLASFVMGANPAVNMVAGVPSTDRDRALLEELVSVTEPSALSVTTAARDRTRAAGKHSPRPSPTS